MKNPITVHCCRALGLGIVLLVLAFLPEQASACAYSYGDIYADETTVYAWSGVGDTYNDPGCNGGWWDFSHGYYAYVELSSPSARYGAGSGSSGAYGGGGWTEAWGVLGIEDEAGIYSFSRSEAIYCTALAGYVYQGGGGGQVQVPPRITASGNTIWWFSYAEPSGYPTSITLTSSAGGATTWWVVLGSDKVHLSATSGAQITVRSSGIAFSQAVGEILIGASANGVNSGQLSLTTRTPYRAVFIGQITTCTTTPTGYETLVAYSIEDNLGDPLPSPVGVNEYFPGEVHPDYPGNDWGRGPANGILLPTSGFQDQISQGGAFYPTPTCPGEGVIPYPVIDFDQEWRIGSIVTGAGRRIQTNILVKYTEHGEHLSPISPNP